MTQASPHTSPLSFIGSSRKEENYHGFQKSLKNPFRLCVKLDHNSGLSNGSQSLWNPSTKYSQIGILPLWNQGLLVFQGDLYTTLSIQRLAWAGEPTQGFLYWDSLKRRWRHALVNGAWLSLIPWRRKQQPTPVFLSGSLWVSIWLPGLAGVLRHQGRIPLDTEGPFVFKNWQIK